MLADVLEARLGAVIGKAHGVLDDLFDFGMTLTRGAQFLKESSLVASFHNFGSYVEIGLAGGSDPQQLLRLALDHGCVTRFELSEPSLEQIFIALVGKGK